MGRQIKISARGWPWQPVGDHWSRIWPDLPPGEKHGWNPLKVKASGRFGDLWAIKFGIQVSGDFSDWGLNLGLGFVRIQFLETP